MIDDLLHHTHIPPSGNILDANPPPPYAGKDEEAVTRVILYDYPPSAGMPYE